MRDTVYPGDDAVVGVAAPVIVYFGVEPADKAAVAKHVTLTTTPAVEGAWAWIQHDDGRWALDYRTKDYWPAGTKVHVSAKLYGVEFAPGALRRRRHHQRLHHRPQPGRPRRRQLARAGGAAGRRHRRQLPRLLRPRRDIGDPNLVTRSGTHIVTGKDENKLMSNPALRLHQRPGEMGGADQQQRRVHPRQPGHRRRPGQQQRHPRLHQPVR